MSDEERGVIEMTRLSLKLQDEIERHLPEIDRKFHLKEKGICRIKFTLLTAEDKNWTYEHIITCKW